MTTTITMPTDKNYGLKTNIFVVIFLIFLLFMILFAHFERLSGLQYAEFFGQTF